jgi:chemotaxis protein histidine kinase CheA
VDSYEGSRSEDVSSGTHRGVGILRCERPVRQEEVDPDQLTRLREYFDTIKGEALYLGYEDAAGLARHVEAILNQAVARGGAQRGCPVVRRT